jgi:glycosyltransferase involved in cell wall biosynthesis
MNQKLFKFLLLIVFSLGILAFFDKSLAVGLLFLILLTAITFLIIQKLGVKEKTLFLLFLLTLFIHLTAVLFIHYAHFQPFSGGEGDYIVYQQQAQEIAQRVRQGNFSLQGLSIGHYYPVIIGYIYAVTLPEMLIGQLFGVWLAALSVLLTYLIVLEIGGSKNWAFLIGLLVSIYPSYLFYGSLLLKDSLVVPLALAGLFLTIKLIKKFSWRDFLILYLILTALIHFRFYIGYVLLFTFIFCWLILSQLNPKRRFIYGIIIIFLLGFSPQISGYGYYGVYTIENFLNPQKITYYREVAYVPPATQPPPTQPPGTGSSIVVETGFDSPLKFIGNFLKSFVYVLLGPLPWQMKYPRHFFALLETIPWYFLLFFVIKGAIRSFKRYKIAIPLTTFSLGVFSVLALFLSNFGIVTRIRIPAFISLLCLIPLSFTNFHKKGVDVAKNNKIKVCQIASIDMTLRFMLLNQLKFLKDEGYEVQAVCSSGKWIKEIEENGIKVKTIEIKRKISPISDLIALFQLLSFLKKEKFDIVHTHTPKASFLGQLAAKISGVPIIINTIHGFYFQKNSPRLKRKFFIFIEKIAALCSNLIFSVNKEDIETAIEEKICNPNLIKYLGDGIDLSRFNPERFSQEFIRDKKKKLDINPQKKIIGIIARLVREKGFLELFEAFKEVLKKFPNTLLLVIGPKEPEKKDAISPEIVKNYRIEKNVIFLGERTDVDEIYPLMDIFVLPSHREGLGLSLLEASAMKKPVVATNIRGCREAVDNNKTGILVSPKDPEKLAEALIYLLSNPEMAKEMGDRGRIKVIKEFDERLVFDRIKKEYQKLIQEKLR